MAAPRAYAADNVVNYAYDGSITIPQYALMYHDTDDVKPAASQADGGTEDLNTRAFAKKFAGVALEAKTSTAAADTLLPVAREFDGEFDCASATFEVGDMVAVDEDAGGTFLENLKLVKTTDSSIAIGHVTRRVASAATRVRVKLVARAGSIAGWGNRPKIFNGNGVNTETLSGAKILVPGDAPIQRLDPGGAARNVDLPPVTGMAGEVFIIENTSAGANIITVRLTGGGATVSTPTQNEVSFVYCDGTTWKALQGASN